MARELTGGKVLAITVSAFAIIIGVNVLLAFKAVSTFPGLEVENSYVASQGTVLGRAGRVHVDTDDAGAVWIGGGTVTCVTGSVTIPV